MSHYLFIESLDPFETRDVEAYLSTALDLRKQDEQVTVFFVENGANAVRAGTKLPLRDALSKAGASVLVDEFALRERGINPGSLTEGVASATVEHIVDLLADANTKAVWH